MDCFVPIDRSSDFPIHNLPYGIFGTPTDNAPRVGVAIGEFVADLSILTSLFNVPECLDVSVFRESSLNKFMESGRATWKATRDLLQRILSKSEGVLRDDRNLQSKVLIPQDQVQMHLPVEIGDFTDFSASKKHAENDRIMFTDKQYSVLPNWHYIPVAYHSRASSVIVSGTGICRPKGQVLSTSAGTAVSPSFSATKKIDYEAELGALIGIGNDHGKLLMIDDAEKHVFGMVLMNDWSARDIQEWEWAPLGPFLCKNFATTISPWVVTMDALEPFRIPACEQNPKALPYLEQNLSTTFDIQIDVSLRTENGGSTAFSMSSSNYKHMYWTLSQQIAHHTSNGCNLRTGDLLGSGTISGPVHSSSGSLSELSRRGTTPVQLENGESRSFLLDGDQVVIRGSCQLNGLRIGFGECSGTVLPAN